MFSGKPVDERMLKFFQKGMEKTLDTINDVWLKDQKYLCGNTISVADLFGICELDQPSKCKQPCANLVVSRYFMKFLKYKKNHMFCKP